MTESQIIVRGMECCRLSKPSVLPQTVVYGEECSKAKPHPEPYLEAMRIIGVPDPARALVLEDSPSGIRAGVAAGCPVVAVDSGGHAHSRLQSEGEWPGERPELQARNDDGR